MNTSRIRRRKSRDRLDVLTFEQSFDLTAGPFGDAQSRRGWRLAFVDDAERRSAWERHRDELMQRRTADRFSTGKRPEAFWQYDAARPELLRARDVPGDHVEATFSFEAEMALLQARTAYLAEHDLLEPHELANIRRPHPRQDGALHAWDEAALAGLRQALPTP